MSAGDVLVEYDEQFERYGVPDPRVRGAELQPHARGPQRPDLLRHAPPNGRVPPTSTSRRWSLPADTKLTAPIVTYTVDHPRPVIRTESTASPLLVAGNGAGVSAASAAGTAGRQPDDLLLRHDGHPAGAGKAAAGRRAEPGGDRHQSQAGLALERDHGKRRLHRDGHLARRRLRRPPRLAARPLPGGTGGRLCDHGVRRRELDHRLELRIADPVLQRPAPRRGHGRLDVDGVGDCPRPRPSASGGRSSSTTRRRSTTSTCRSW